MSKKMGVFKLQTANDSSYAITLTPKPIEIKQKNTK
jgi:hypothetical protein